MAVKAKYQGDGNEHLYGIPARDLSDDEYAALDTDQKKAVRSSGLYDVRSDAPKEPAPAAKDDKDEKK